MFCYLNSILYHIISHYYRVQDLPDRAIELQGKLEDLEPNVHNNRIKSQYENVRTKLADAKLAIWALGSVLDRYSSR